MANDPPRSVSSGVRLAATAAIPPLTAPAAAARAMHGAPNAGARPVAARKLWLDTADKPIPAHGGSIIVVDGPLSVRWEQEVIHRANQGLNLDRARDQFVAFLVDAIAAATSYHIPAPTALTKGVTPR